MLNRRKDSENFPELDQQSTKKDIIDPTKEIEFKVKAKPKIEEPKKPEILTSYKQVAKFFEKIMNEIKPGEGLEKVKKLPIVDLVQAPTVEELFPTKPREVFRPNKGKRRKKDRRVQGEVISLTKGRYAK